MKTTIGAIFLALLLTSCGSQTSGDSSNNGSDVYINHGLAKSYANPAAISSAIKESDFIKTCEISGKSFTNPNDYDNATSGLYRVEAYYEGNLQATSCYLIKTNGGARLAYAYNITNDTMSYILATKYSNKDFKSTGEKKPISKTEFDNAYKNIITDNIFYGKNFGEKFFNHFFVLDNYIYSRGKSGDSAMVYGRGPVILKTIPKDPKIVNTLENGAIITKNDGVISKKVYKIN